MHHLNAEDITPTGPNGRLLKGDVLAYLDQIPSSYPKELASRFSKLSHLDLSNIKPAAPKETAPKQESAPAVEEEKAPEPPVNVVVPVSLTAVLEVQRRMQDSIGITLPLSTFIARAIALANEDLPHPRRAPTADELFHSVLGLDKVHHRTKLTKNGSFNPQIVALPDPSLRMSSSPRPAKNKADAFDEIIGTTKNRTAVPAVRGPGALGAVGAERMFRLSVGKEDERRAKVFLERVKSVLEAEPGRLVL
jgi:hypothetical protein